MLTVRKYLKFLFPFLFIYCGNPKTDLSDVEIIFDNNLMLFTKNSKPYSGKIIEHHDNKQIKIEMEVLNGLKNGNINQYYRSGKIQTHSNFINGKLFGKFTSFHENGNEQIITFYNNDLRMGSFEEFHDNQKLKLCGSYFNSLKIGQFEEYFKSGGKAIYNY